MRMRTFSIGLLSLSACVAEAATAEELPGKKIFEQRCAECHAAGFGHPGTQRLGWSRGEKYAELAKRTDLSADYIKLIVRRGLAEMPPFRPTEISDAELAQLSAYLTKKPVSAR